MTLIHVPKPKIAINPNRTANSLLRAQIDHFHEAEKRLPLRYHTDIYVNAIQTEGEAANYIRAVTEAIHRAHAEAEAQRAARVPARRRGLAIAAAAAGEPEPKRRRKSKKARKSKPKKK